MLYTEWLLTLFDLISHMGQDWGGGTAQSHYIHESVKHTPELQVSMLSLYN